MDEHVVVIGAGPAGLAAAWAIRRAGVDPVVVDQADSVAASWQGRHDHLRLNTHQARQLARAITRSSAAAGRGGRAQRPAPGTSRSPGQRPSR